MIQKLRPLAILCSVAAAATPAFADPISLGRIRDIDGDTIRIDQSQPDHRLVGYIAPETRRAANNAERELGGHATPRLREIIRGGKLDYTVVECACALGTAGTWRCNYGRYCGRLISAGEDVGSILIREGLAVSFVCGPTRCPKTPNPWR